MYTIVGSDKEDEVDFILGTSSMLINAKIIARRLAILLEDACELFDYVKICNNYNSNDEIVLWKSYWEEL